MDFPKAERHRGAKQHAHDVPYDAVPCSSIGARMSFDGDISAGAMMPTQTFKGMQTLTFGDTVLELHEAPGETDDQLLVWMPEAESTLPVIIIIPRFQTCIPLGGPRHAQRRNGQAASTKCDY